MTTYVYETIPRKSGAQPRQFEIRQHMSDPPLTKHPESGEPIRRIIMGGYGVLGSSSKEADTGAQAPRSCCGGGSCGCH